MRKVLFFTIFTLLTSVIAIAAGPEITFKTMTHDFGTIHASKGPVSYEYEFKNTGDKPLVIVSVTNGGCGCTTPEFTQEPIQPGGTGIVKITFSPEGRKGEFKREVKVKTNASTKREGLRFNGVIIP